MKTNSIHSVSLESFEHIQAKTTRPAILHKQIAGRQSVAVSLPCQNILRFVDCYLLLFHQLPELER